MQVPVEVVLEYGGLAFGELDRGACAYGWFDCWFGVRRSRGGSSGILLYGILLYNSASLLTFNPLSRKKQGERNAKGYPRKVDFRSLYVLSSGGLHCPKTVEQTIRVEDYFARELRYRH